MWCRRPCQLLFLSLVGFHLLPLETTTSAFTPRWGDGQRAAAACRLLGIMSASTTPTENHRSINSSWDEDDEEEDGSDGEDGVEDDDNDSSPLLLQEYQIWSKALDQAIESLRKKRTSLESEWSRAQGVEELFSRAQLLVSNLYLFNTPGVTSVTVQDWENDGIDVELVLDDKQYESASAEADALFAKARKLKRGSKVVSDLLEQTADAWNNLQEAQLDLQSALVGGDDDQTTVDQDRLALVQDRLIRSSRTTNFQTPSDESDNNGQSAASSSSNSNRRNSKPEIGTPLSNIRKLKSPGGCTVFVGRNRRGNEHLSLTVARGNDIWMHSRGCPGAHVVVMNRRGGPTPTDECLQFAADLAIFYSDFRNENKAPVSAAEPKHLLKPRGAPLGAIKVREELKTLIGFPDRVPDELKISREESGQSNEYRSTDKAKHRRRTKQATIEQKAKRKKGQKEKKSQDDFY